MKGTGEWGGGGERELYPSVRPEGFTKKDTISSPRATPPAPEMAPMLVMLSEPWYETPSRISRIRSDTYDDSQTGGATHDRSTDSLAREAEAGTVREPVVEKRPRGYGTPTKPPFK